MPLPAESMPWPPAEAEQAQHRMTVHDAWYAGEQDRLERVYQRPPAPVNRPAQYAGGLRGMLARAWYGKPSAAGQAGSRLHSGLPGDMSSAAAELLFADPPRIRPVDEAATGAQDQLDQLAERVGLWARMSEGAEIGSALGGVFLRAWWDTDIAAHPLVQVVHPDRAYPRIAGGRLLAVTFETVVRREDQRVWRHIERHEPDGTVLHGLYEGTPENLGSRRNLLDDPATAGLPDVVDSLGGLLVSYAPNMLPNPIERGSWLGRSDYTRNESLFDWADETLTSWRRDVRLAKGRLIVPQGYVTPNGPGQGASFDLDREVYEQINMPPMSANGASPITVAQFAIRVEEHRGTFREIVTRAVSNAGYSASTFGLDEAGAAATATEIRERKSRTLTRRDKQINYFGPALRDLGAALGLIEATVFGRPGLAGLPLAVEWPDGVTVDLLTLAQTARELRDAEAASDETIVRTVHPDWTDTQVTEEAAKIGAARPPLLPELPGSDLP